MANTMTLISSQTFASSATSATFSSIPQTYTDLKIVVSARTDNSLTFNSSTMTFNGSSTGYSERNLYGNSTGTVSANNTNNYLEYIWTNGGNTTASTFGNLEIYIPNYTSSNYKSASFDMVFENNSTSTNGAIAGFQAGLWTNTAAITSLAITSGGGTNFVQYSTFYLYGIKSS